MNNFCDLHTHSKLSDGSSTPEELIAEAVALGLSAVALTDHNTMDGLPAFLAAAEGQNILAIPGVEFSVDYEGTELHLLGLFIDPARFPALREITRDYLQRKDESNRELVAALTRDGYVLDYEHIQAKSPNGNINRSHIADALLEKGYCKTKEAAFKEFLAKNGKYYREPTKPPVWDMLDFLTGIHAVPVLAHPFLNLDAERLAEFLPKAKARGLIGMEVRYTLFDDAETELAARMARDFGLLPSGGSDYHGTRKNNTFLGVGSGNLRIPLQWALNLRDSVKKEEAE